MSDLREKLVDAAEQLIVRHGAHGFSLREAARKVRVDPAMVYRSFKDRADLASAVADRGFLRLSRQMRAALEKKRRPTPEQQLRVLGHVYVKFALTEPSLFALMFGPDRGRITRFGDEPSPIALVQKSVAGLQLALSPEDAAAVCWAAMHGVAQLLLAGSLQRTLPGANHAVTEHVLDTLIAGLERGGSKKFRSR